MKLRGLIKGKCRWIVEAIVLCSAMSASALSLSVTNVAAVAIRTADWSQSVYVQQFNPSYGTLTGVQLQLTTTIRSTPRMENLDAVPRTLVGGSSGSLSLTRTGSATPLLTAQGSVTITNTVTAFDGTIDYGGATGNYGSGFSAPPISAQAIAGVQLPSGSADFQSFVGTSYATLGFAASATPIATGASSISSSITSEVGAEVKVIYTYTPFVASVAGTVWVDVNQDGLVTSGEPVLPNVTVTLLDSGGFPVPGATQVTDSNGSYQFTNLVIDPAIGYALFSVAISQPAGYTQIYDLDDGLNPTPASPLVATFYLNYNENKTVVNFGFANNSVPGGGATGNRLHGFVWLDGNGNGFQDAMEPGFGGVQVMLMDGVTGSILASTTTDAAGLYLFTGISDGSYRVRVIPVINYVNYTLSLRDVNGNASDSFDSDVDINSGVSGSVLVSGGMDVPIDAGLVPVLLDNYVDEPVGTTSKAFTLSGIVSDLIFNPDLGDFHEVDTGDAILTGFLQSRSNPANGFSVSIVFSGYSPVPPAGVVGSPKMDLPGSNYIQNGGPINPATWGYYSSFRGTLTGVGAYKNSVLAVTNSAPSFQVGYGANGVDLNWGAAGWFNYTTVSQPSPALPTKGTGAMYLDLNNRPTAAPAATLCQAMVVSQKFDRMELQLTVMNKGSTDLILSGFDFDWPASIGKLKQVKFDCDTVYDSPGIFTPGHVVSAQLVTDLTKRKIQRGTSDVVHLIFEKDICGTSISDYTGTLYFGGCSVSITTGCGCNCNLGYPYTSSNPLTSVIFNESEVLRLLEPENATAGGTIRVFYSDEHALLLGVRNATNVVTPMTSNPGHAVNPAVGDPNARDPSGRPLFPALFITDVTFSLSTTGDDYRLGDWQYGGTPIPPHEIFGTWKAATKSGSILTTDANPAMNYWTLGPGSDTPAVGFTALKGQGYGTEIRWNVKDLRFKGAPLQAGHKYRVQVMVHDGDQNKSGGDVGQSCLVVTIQP